MTIKAIILDVNGTMMNRSSIGGSYTVVQGIPEMISSFRQQNITVFAASNNFYDAFHIKGRLEIDDDKILYPTVVGGKKGTKRFVQHVCSQLKISPMELLYLGDSQNDCNEAVNSNIAFFLAAWSKPTFKYGIPIETPVRFAEIVKTFFLKEHLWYYRVDDKDGLGRKVTVRALLDPDISKEKGITDLLKSKGERGLKVIKGFSSDKYLSLHLFASVYLEGLHISSAGRKLIWCMYPGHDGRSTSILDSFVEMISRQFHERYFSDLIQRHKQAIRSSTARSHGNAPKMDNQLQTIQLNPSMSQKIAESTVFIIDDFTTYAQGFETSRNFLLNAGAKSVVCIAVGKYSKSYTACYPKPGISWNSFEPTQLTEDDFDTKYVQSKIDKNAILYF